MKTRYSKLIVNITAIFLLLITCLPLSAQDDDPIGRVVLIKGDVAAVSPTGDRRQLRRGSEVIAEDTIVTGAAGFAQIRMVDSAIIALKESSEFTFNEYSFDGEGGAADRAVMNLVRGGFRTIDGIIGQDAGDEYEIQTEFASIGVRGTTHEAVIDGVLDALFTGVYDGGTTVTNPQGTIELGVGAGFDFSQTNRGQAPRGLQQIPGQLGNINLNPAADEEEEQAQEEEAAEEEQAGAGDDDNGDGDADDGADQDNADDDTAAADAGGADDGDADNQQVAGNDNDGNGNNAGGQGANNGNNGNDGGNNQVAAFDNEGVANPAVNARLTELSEDHPFGANNLAGTNTDNNTDVDANVEENIEEDDTETPVINVVAALGNNGNGNGNGIGNGLGNGNGNGPNSAPTEIAIQALGNTSTNIDVQINPSNNLQQATVAPPDADGDGVIDSLDAFPNDPTESMDSDGDGVGDNADAFPNNAAETLDSDGDGVGDNADVFPNNFAESVDSDGDGVGDNADVFPNDATETLDSDGDGVGDNADFYPNDPSRFQKEEENEGSSDGDEDGDDNKGHGNDEDGFDEDNPGQGNSDKDGDGTPGKSGGAPGQGGKNDDDIPDTLDFGVDWGNWSVPGVASVSVNADGFDIVSLSILVPANMDAMRDTSARWDFASNGNFAGSGTAGTLTNLDMGFKVNLGTGKITGGSFSAVVGGSENWSTKFSGDVIGATATMGRFSNGISGSMRGAFTGTDGFVSGFALTNGSSALGGLAELKGTPQ